MPLKVGYYLRTNYMSDAFIHQVTLDCLLNKELYKSQVHGKKTKQINKEEHKFYRKRIFNLFKEIINRTPPDDLLPDVTYAFDNFVNSAVNYLKTIDTNDINQANYAELDAIAATDQVVIADSSNNPSNSLDADLCLLRSIKIDTPTLDKYVIRTKTKRSDNVIMPQQKDINLKEPCLKNKGIEKNKKDKKE
jgi:hypothetical protein